MVIETLTVKMIEVEASALNMLTERLEEISYRAWNIKREIKRAGNGYFDLELVSGTNLVKVKHSQGRDWVDEAVSEWGKVVSVESEKRVAFNVSDLTEQALKGIDEAYSYIDTDGYSSDATLTIAD